MYEAEMYVLALILLSMVCIQQTYMNIAESGPNMGVARIGYRVHQGL